MSEKTKTYFIQNLGCAKNKCDGAFLASIFEQNGYKLSINPTTADIVLLNTCGFIESAREEAIEEFFNLQKSIKKGAKIIIAGCLAQRYAADLQKNLPEADYILGNNDISALKAIIQNIEDSKSASAEKVFGVDIKVKTPAELYSSCHKIYPSFSLEESTAFVKIAEGCNHRCSFCAIPLIRGNLVSLPQDAVLQSVKVALSKGAHEINLVAQDLINYGKDRGGKTELYSLLDKICSLPGDFWVRMLYIHPDFFEMELLDLLLKYKGKLLPYFDLPIQHISSNILPKMGRKGSYDTYKALFSNIRSKIPDVILRTTFLFGFPGETKEDAEQVKSFIREGLLDYVGFFIYSPENGTSAEKMTPSKNTKKYLRALIDELNEIQDPITEKHFEHFVGTTQKMIIEHCDYEGTCVGRIWAQAPEVDGITNFTSPNQIKQGDIVNVKIINVDGYDFEAALV